MINNEWVNETTVIQVLLDAEAGIGNVMPGSNAKTAKELRVIRATLHKQIECLRGPAPACYGQDDCSTDCLSTCPWRLTCGDN